MGPQDPIFRSQILDLQQQLLATLDDGYRDLASQLGYEPSEKIIVILYTQKEFVDITEAPSWAGAINDGKLRIPIRGVSVMNTELARVLKHELTHSFLSSLAGGRCPTWLNEGMAQMMEPRSSSIFVQPLAAVFQQRKEIRSPCWSIRSFGFPTYKRRLRMLSLYPRWIICESDTAWEKY